MPIKGRNTAVRWLIFVFLLVTCLGTAKHYLFPTDPDSPPREVIGKALKNTEKAKQYEYTIKMFTTIDGTEKQVSEVQGQRESLERIHISGRIFNSEVEFYLYDNDTYTKDQLTGEWIKLTGNQLNQQEIFMAELNPLASFTYKELEQAAFDGSEGNGPGKLLVYSALPVVDNPYMETLWKDFKYRFWLEPRSLFIHKGEVTAVSKNGSADKLRLVVELRNYNSNIKINPPEVKQ
ncbi:hypothetical protein [Phosphitispora sp. TUW77]|uniref:hypothetical protein n=1 Tax=Phosphitispora sp. TUW77 TaxID=3152361 RepID=UPI003AB4B533